MRFEMWSVWHYLLMLAPALFMTALYFLLRKRSDKTRYIVGVVIGTISLGILLLRNIDIFLSEGFCPGIIPLQVCHFGNIMVLVHHQLDLYDSGRSDRLCGDVRDFQHPKTVLSER